MELSKKVVLSTTLSIILASQLLAQSFSTGGGTLEDAIKDISKQSNMTYMVDGRILEGKKAPNIENIEGLQSALNELLKGTDLEATIQENTIIIKKVSSIKVINGAYVLDDISVNSGGNGGSENGYVTKEISGVGIWDKRSLQDTPYQISVVSSEMIENTGNDINQIFKMNPTTQLNYTSTSSNSWNQTGLNIRGFSAVGNTILDGVPFSNAYTSLSQDYERVEVLNGLSGFLYGVGYVGGTVNYVTKKPTLERLTNITVGTTGNEAAYVHADLGGKIDEKGKFTYRLNAFKQDGETSIKDQKVDNTLISGALDYRATDNLILSFDASHKKGKTDKLTGAIGSSASANNFDPKQGYSPDWTFSDVSQDRFGFKSLWQINDNIKLRTGYIYLENKSDMSQPWMSDNYDGTYDFSYDRYYPEKSKKHGAYIYTDFDFNTFGVEHTLTIGGSGNKGKSYESNPREYKDFGTYTLNQINSIQKPNYLGSSNNPMYKSNSSEKINFMVGDDIKFNEQWSALLGLNYAKTESSNYSRTTGNKTSSYDADKITPTLSLIFKPFEDLTTYATYIESLENGVIVANTYKNAGEVFEPYKSKQYEVGAKYSMSENLLLSSALFRIEKANKSEDFSTAPKTLTQDGLVIHQGLELTVTGKLTDNLTIVGGGTIMDLEIDKTTDRFGTVLDGKKPTNTASKMAKLYAEYNIPFIQGLIVTGGAYYTGKSYRDGENTEVHPSYTIYDAGLRYKTKIDKFPTTFLVNATNVTGKKYWRNHDLGEPTNLAFSMKMEF